MVVRGVPGINTVILGAVPALCENAPYIQKCHFYKFRSCAKWESERCGWSVTDSHCWGVAPGPPSSAGLEGTPRPLDTPSVPLFYCVTQVAGTMFDVIWCAIISPFILQAESTCYVLWCVNGFHFVSQVTVRSALLWQSHCSMSPSTHGGAAGPGPCMRTPPAPPPPPQVLKDSWGVGRIRTGCSRPPRASTISGKVTAQCHHRPSHDKSSTKE